MAGKYQSPDTALTEIIEKQKLEIASIRTENQKLREQVILAQNDRIENLSLKNIISLMPGSIYWKDLEGKYLGCNNYIVNMCKLSSTNDVIGKQLKDFFDPDIAKQIEQTDLDVLLSNETKHCEEKGFSENQEPAIFLTQKTPLRDAQGKTIGLLGISFDITERKKIEEDLKVAKEKAEASSRAKSQFLAIVNHELRTPLASIVGLLSILKRKDLTVQEQQNALENIEICTQYLLSLIDDVLDFSRLETGKYSLHNSPVNVHALLSEVYNMLKPLAENKGLALKIDCTADSSCAILTDARILRQILINLTTNALKFTESGHVTIKLAISPHGPHEVWLHIAVIDTGKGIPKNKFDHIFEPFQQLEDAYTRQSSRNGTGLGLAIVKKLAELIDAKVQLKSKVREGSTFSVSAKFQTTQLMPKQPARIIKTKKKIKPKTVEAFPLLELMRKPTIMLIEDDPIVQYVHKKMLEDLGCEVDVVSCGLDAINRLKHHDIVLVDISLPDMSGFDVIKSIRKAHDDRKIPIVALTAYNGKEEKAACLSAGANAFKNKPISQTTLKRLLMRYLEE